MSREIYVNIPVKDLKRSVDFFTGLGFTFNPQFTGEKATCMIIGEKSFVMLLTENFFKTFIKKEISDATKNTEVILAITAESRAKVDEMADKAIATGGKKSNDPQDHGWMYYRSFQDLDGHLWEVTWLDPAGPPKS
jgi:predicted lactoylglutathione lyase